MNRRQKKKLYKQKIVEWKKENEAQAIRCGKALKELARRLREMSTTTDIY